MRVAETGGYLELIGEFCKRACLKKVTQTALEEGT